MMRFLAGFLIGEYAPMNLVVKPLLTFGFRFYVAYVFFKSGLTKVDSNFLVTPSTIDLFKYEYSVPILPPEFAAYLASYAELLLPIMLVIGFLSSPAALALFILNFVAAISYPDINLVGEWQHVVWGTMLAVIFAFGPGKVSIDKWISNKLYGRDTNILVTVILIAVLSAISYLTLNKFL